MTVLVDTNVILDVLTDDPRWSEWSLGRLEHYDSEGLVISPMVYSELCFGFKTPTAVDDLVRQFRLVWQEVPRLGLFKAAKAFEAYKSRGGNRRFVLPDFFIGGHAEATGLPILTRDIKRFRTYFPSVRLISPG